MKLIIAGATGFVGTEVVSQALQHPSITSVVALGRRPTAPPENAAGTTKLKSVVCEDMGAYSETAKNELKGADACIWLLAVTPTKSKTMQWDQVRKICHDYTMTGLETMAALPRDSKTPFRFVYTSGSNAERDPTKKPWILGDYCLMRGECETDVLEFAKRSNGKVESCIIKPGLISGPGRDGLFMKAAQVAGQTIINLPTVDVKDVAAAALNLAVSGFETDTVLNDELTSLGQKARGQEGQAAGS